MGLLAGVAGGILGARIRQSRQHLILSALAYNTASYAGYAGVPFEVSLGQRINV